MQLQQRINAFVALGKFLKQFSSPNAEKDPAVEKNELFFETMQDVLRQAESNNTWFTKENLQFTCAAWGEALKKEKIERWLSNYTISETNNDPKTIAIIMAGNIPLVGLHDFLCVLISGNQVLAKLSSNDTILLPFITQYLIAIAPEFENKITLTSEKIENFDAVIATGSNNTALYFEHYFGKYPHIIRKNRNSVALLTGEETPEQMEALADDIFRYFGLGCRNVSKIYVPSGYDWDHFFNGMFAWKEIINNHKYINNYDYNKAVYLMSNIQLLDNEFMMLKEDTGFASPISVVFYEYYSNRDEVVTRINSCEEQIQCMVSKKHTPFGAAQSPELWDYADGVDTMEFLLNL